MEMSIHVWASAAPQSNLQGWLILLTTQCVCINPVMWNVVKFDLVPHILLLWFVVQTVGQKQNMHVSEMGSELSQFTTTQ